MKIRNWEKYQHYKDRNPPWIKLHFELLSSKDWVMLDDASRVLAIACMLIASRNDGEIPDDPEYIKRVAYLNSLPNYKPLIDSGFLENASTLQADASTLQADASTLQADASTLQADARPETETETETEAEAEKTAPAKTRKKTSTNKFTPPAFDEFKAYCESKGFGHIARRSFDYYEAGDWRNRDGRKISSWKQTMVAVWFDENKNPKPEEQGPSCDEALVNEIANNTKAIAEPKEGSILYEARKSKQTTDSKSPEDGIVHEPSRESTDDGAEPFACEEFIY